MDVTEYHTADLTDDDQRVSDVRVGGGHADCLIVTDSVIDSDTVSDTVNDSDTVSDTVNDSKCH